MYSFIASIVVFLTAVVLLFITQFRPMQRRKSKMHDIKTSATNIIQLQTKYNSRHGGSVAQKVDEAVKLR